MKWYKQYKKGGLFVKYATNLFITVVLTMIAIYIVKKVSTKYNVPFMKDVAKEV